jgi:DNA polymerase
VVGEGSLDSPVMLVGEGPGRKEDETGRLFVGSARRLLDKLLSHARATLGEIRDSSLVSLHGRGIYSPL